MEKILEKSGNFVSLEKWEPWYYLLNLIKFSVKKQSLKKILENGKKYWKSQGKAREFCQSGKVGTLFKKPGEILNFVTTEKWEHVCVCFRIFAYPGG